MSQKRIEFIDLAKGVCMIAIVLGHCGIGINGATTLPLYLMISGMFFKKYDGTRTFLIKKANGILIPFIFFYLIGCAAFYGIKCSAPQLFMPKTGIEILSSNWSIAIITLLLSAACIPICKRQIPWFVAQKDLIR